MHDLFGTRNADKAVRAYSICAAAMLKGADVLVEIDAERGFDRGVFVPMKVVSGRRRSGRRGVGGTDPRSRAPTRDR